MVYVKGFIATFLIISSTYAAPFRFNKRIAQIITEATADWEQACLRAGGAQKCNPLSQKAFMALLAAAGNCEQQNAADEMVTLAKGLGNDAEMIRLAQLYVQQPRNSPNSFEVPYCKVAPKNSELNGLFHCQFASSKFGTFSGDQTGNLPLGVSAVNPPGSCPANPTGPVPDGQQLNKIVRNPQAGNSTPQQATPPPANNACGSSSLVKSPPAPPPPAQSPSAHTLSAATPPASGGMGSGFALQNGRDAKALNEQFSRLTPASPCQQGQVACINGGFAQCVDGKFVIFQCASGLQCFALPLVNSPGTSVTCTTAADKDARIAATGA